MADVSGRAPGDGGWRTGAWVADGVLLLVLAFLALVVRTVDLSNYPPGLHGDEAWTVLDARDIIDGVSKWPYTDAALGQPAGPMYFSVPFEGIWGPSILAARLPQAIIGALTVVVGFYAILVLFGRPMAWIWAVLAAFSSWLIFYNRTGFTVSAFPLTEMASLLAVGLALRSRWWPWYVAAGIVVGAGLYGYFSYPLFAVGLALYVMAHLLVEQPRPLGLHLRNVAVMGLMALLVIMPMRPYFFDETTGYRADRTDFAVSKTEAYRSADGTLERVDVYVDNVVRMGKSLVWNGWPDFSDGSGDVSALDYTTTLLAIGGLGASVYLAWTRRKAAYLLPWIMIPIILIGPAWNFAGYHRRSLGILVFVLILAALPLSLLWDWAARSERKNAVTLAAAALGIIGAVYIGSNLYRYFEQPRGSFTQSYTYGTELTDALLWVRDTQPEGTPVYFFATRWSSNHETVRYLLRDYPRFDRADRFAAEEADRSLPAIQPGQRAVILLVSHITPAEDYIRRYDEAARSMYPEAVRYEGPVVNGRIGFVAYQVGG